jgi:hypothetical protein
VQAVIHNVLPLVAASETANLDACKALLTGGADPNKHNSDDDEASALLEAVNQVMGDGEPKGVVSIDRPIEFAVDFETLVLGLELSVRFHIIFPAAGDVLSAVNSESASTGQDVWAGKVFPKGRFRSTCVFPANSLNEGTFLVNVAIILWGRVMEIFLREVLQFTAQDTEGMRKEYMGLWIGVVRPRLPWETELLAEGT